MKIAIFASIIPSGVHEVDFDRMLVDELIKLGHKVSFMVPQNFTFKYDYGVPVLRLPGDAASYTGIKGLKKILVSAQKEINSQRWYNAISKEIICQNIDTFIVPTSTYRYLRALNINKLKYSSNPIIFILYGITPKDATAVLAQIEKFKSYPNIKTAVISFVHDIFGHTPPDTTYILPPAYLPRDISEHITLLNKAIPGQSLCRIPSNSFCAKACRISQEKLKSINLIFHQNTFLRERRDFV
ncbi:MAG: hypothetical protein LBR56_08820 [Sporomusaceae bacterium]|jgi:hypothetical protein|nr:hypothetical protein [Sporomusaceae bacterium]